MGCVTSMDGEDDDDGDGDAAVICAGRQANGEKWAPARQGPTGTLHYLQAKAYGCHLVLQLLVSLLFPAMSCQSRCPLQ